MKVLASEYCSFIKKESLCSISVPPESFRKPKIGNGTKDMEHWAKMFFNDLIACNAKTFTIIVKQMYFFMVCSIIHLIPQLIFKFKMILALKSGRQIWDISHAVSSGGV